MARNLAEALPEEINRVRAVQDRYKELRNMPNAIVEPQIMLMEAAIQRALESMASGNTIEMLKAYKALTEWEA